MAKQIVKVSAHLDTTDPSNPGWYAATYARDSDGDLEVVDDSHKAWFPVDLDLYGSEQRGYVRDALEREFPGAEIVVQ